MRCPILLVFLIVAGCQSVSNQLGEASPFLPNASLLKDGLVWKYYVHQKHKSWNTPKTDIEYVEFRLNEDNLEVTEYDAEFKPTHFFVIKMEGPRWRLDSEFAFKYYGLSEEELSKYESDIEEDVYMHWSEQSANLKKSQVLTHWSTKTATTQNEIKDSIVDEKAVRLFSGEQIYEVTPNDKETQTYNNKWEQTWTEGLGLTAHISKSDDWNTEMELVELMTREAFTKRSNHGTHRVAWIDQTKAIDKGNDFKPCFSESKINDYYNDDDAKFEGGKGAIRAMLDLHLNPEKLNNESGYLTFRFIVNCKGEAGRFITEESSLEFEPKAFSKSTVNHLYEILQEHGKWKALLIGKEKKARDAYTYLTFKLKDGAIIEILPQ